MALAIAYAGLGDAVKRQADSMFFSQCFQANRELTTSVLLSIPGEFDLTPSDYPEGGGSLSNIRNETRMQRWGR
jgi:hypothetical protein